MQITKRQLVYLGGLVLLVGFLGGMTTQYFMGDDQAYRQIAKLNKVLKLVITNYVDTVDSRQIVDGAITGLLEKLDPHSVYIPPKDLERVNEDFRGKFEGIGVEFRIISDTITITNPIPGGPSVKLGIQAGDRIISIDDSTAIGLKSDRVPKKLRGPKGTKVKVTVYRPSQKRNLDFVIIRDEISLFSVDASLLLDEQTGYIKINRFSSGTHSEFVKALKELRSKGITRLVLDLRGNPGGFLDQAVQMSDEFLPEGKQIVYTKSRDSRSEETFSSTTAGSFETGNLIILIDRTSASASEIVAGAVQDWDRGLIVGETSFGKGLVQKQFPIDEDHSALRLTVSRYYTPSGRLIQRSYKDGKQKYYSDLQTRKETTPVSAAELQLPDSTHPAYKTAGNRTVFGGGGITPDYFVQTDTLNEYTGDLIRKNIFSDFVQNYLDANREVLKKEFRTLGEFEKKFKPSQELLQKFDSFSVNQGVKVTGKISKDDEDWKKNYLSALIARQIWGDKGFYTVNLKTDKVLKTALDLFKTYSEVLDSTEKQKKSE
ncbi:MAG: S41 family peptidase [Bacteroidetes bacterium]|nr:S41 family peptidase [Bacteroidota bacterium]